jgi:hypothetical protein
MFFRCSQTELKEKERELLLHCWRLGLSMFFFRVLDHHHPPPTLLVMFLSLDISCPIKFSRQEEEKFPGNLSRNVIEKRNNSVS